MAPIFKSTFYLNYLLDSLMPYLFGSLEFKDSSTPLYHDQVHTLLLFSSRVSLTWTGRHSTRENHSTQAETATNSTCENFFPGQSRWPKDHGKNVSLATGGWASSIATLDTQ